MPSSMPPSIRPASAPVEMSKSTKARVMGLIILPWRFPRLVLNRTSRSSGDGSASRSTRKRGGSESKNSVSRAMLVRAYASRASVSVALVWCGGDASGSAEMSEAGRRNGQGQFPVLLSELRRTLKHAPTNFGSGGGRATRAEYHVSTAS